MTVTHIKEVNPFLLSLFQTATTATLYMHPSVSCLLPVLTPQPGQEGPATANWLTTSMNSTRIGKIKGWIAFFNNKNILKNTQGKKETLFAKIDFYILMAVNFFLRLLAVLNPTNTSLIFYWGGQTPLIQILLTGLWVFFSHDLSPKQPDLPSTGCSVTYS